MVFTIFTKNNYRPVFGPFWEKMAAVLRPIFPGKLFLSEACFELFCQISGRMATVIKYLSEFSGFPGHAVCLSVYSDPCVLQYSHNNSSIIRFFYFILLLPAIKQIIATLDNFV
jgi:hypothetical protein